MHFRLTDAQRALRDEDREYARTGVRPRTVGPDQTETYSDGILGDLGDRAYAGITLIDGRAVGDRPPNPTVPVR